ncbi:hypothetical protein B0H15DRAFT_289849 [Mycena belliarum]|uniref:Uncharacterized protein n=1 Tax=Mycena belliarum TaxID=1033014 RepID=A0AAD6U3C1_9AGAR|nr:hypothetical protein B0H15DRAFT_289849 [Mycena belliae]
MLGSHYANCPLEGARSSRSHCVVNLILLNLILHSTFSDSTELCAELCGAEVVQLLVELSEWRCTTPWRRFMDSFDSFLGPHFPFSVVLLRAVVSALTLPSFIRSIRLAHPHRTTFLALFSFRKVQLPTHIATLPSPLDALLVNGLRSICYRHHRRAARLGPRVAGRRARLVGAARRSRPPTPAPELPAPPLISIWCVLRVAGLRVGARIRRRAAVPQLPRLPSLLRPHGWP